MILTFNDNEGQALKNLYDQDFNSETMILLRATRSFVETSYPEKPSSKGSLKAIVNNMQLQNR